MDDGQSVTVLEFEAGTICSVENSINNNNENQYTIFINIEIDILSALSFHAPIPGHPQGFITISSHPHLPYGVPRTPC